MIIEEFLSAEQSHKMEILGFKSECLGYWIQDSDKNQEMRFFLVSDLYDAPATLKARVVINRDVLKWFMGDRPAYAAPLTSQAKNWMGVKYGIRAFPDWEKKGEELRFHIKWISQEGEQGVEGEFKTLSEAERVLLDWLLEFCLEKIKDQ